MKELRLFLLELSDMLDAEPRLKCDGEQYVALPDKLAKEIAGRARAFTLPPPERKLVLVMPQRLDEILYTSSANARHDAVTRVTR